MQHAMWYRFKVLAFQRFFGNHFIFEFFIHERKCVFVYLMFYVLVNSYDHVRTLPPFYGTFIQNKDVMASKKCLKHSHTPKPQRLLCMVGST